MFHNQIFSRFFCDKYSEECNGRSLHPQHLFVMSNYSTVIAAVCCPQERRTLCFTELSDKLMNILYIFYVFYKYH